MATLFRLRKVIGAARELPLAVSRIIRLKTRHVAYYYEVKEILTLWGLHRGASFVIGWFSYVYQRHRIPVFKRNPIPTLAAPMSTCVSTHCSARPPASRTPHFSRKFQSVGYTALQLQGYSSAKVHRPPFFIVRGLAYVARLFVPLRIGFFTYNRNSL